MNPFLSFDNQSRANTYNQEKINILWKLEADSWKLIVGSAAGADFFHEQSGRAER
jgi:hypothetical protein